jgi:PAS domain S-box-containing protein
VSAETAQQLRAEDATLRLSAIVESSDDAIVSKDLDGIITSWNPAAERLFGYTAGEVIGRSIRIIIPDDRQGEEDEVLRRVRIGQRIDHFETIRQRKDGSPIPISLTVSPIKDGSGRIIGASKIARDISERVAAEAAIVRSMAMKDQFLSLVSHELRTPSTTILGNALILLRRAEAMSTEDRNQSYQDIATQAQKLQGVVENLLLLTQMEAEQDLDLRPVALEELVSAQVASFERRSDRTVNVVSGEGLPMVPGEPTLLALAIDNLLSNADKYSPPAAPIDITVGRTDAGEVRVSVRDQGIGFAESEMDQLFTPFYRTEGARKQASGMGLGLALTRRIVEAHDGLIWAERPLSGGAEFVFVLRPYRNGDRGE